MLWSGIGEKSNAKVTLLTSLSSAYPKSNTYYYSFNLLAVDTIW